MAGRRHWTISDTFRRFVSPVRAPGAYNRGRRSPAAVHVFHFGDFELDLARYELRRGGRGVELGPKNFDVLAYLVRNPDRLVSKNELIEQVWGVSSMSGSSVPTSIAAIRKVLDDDPSAPVYIETVRGRGYRFIAEVRVLGSEGFSSVEAASPERTFFVGRESELQALYAGFERALTGAPQLMLVAGEAGIGKTRLVEEFAPGGREDGAATLVGRCREGGGAPAFWPWVQIFRGIMEQAPRPSVERLLSADREILGRLLPELVDTEPSQDFASLLDAEQARFQLFEALVRFLALAAAEGPVVAWLDDIHLSDASSIALLAFVIRELRDAPVLFIATYRDVDLQRDPQRIEAVASLAREERSRSIQLHGLSREEVARYLTETLRSAVLDESVAKAVYDQTAGNPFFVTQLVHLLTAGGPLSASVLAQEPATRLSGGVRESIARQLDSLSEDARRIVSVASVFGRDFPSIALASVFGAGSDPVVGAVEEAVAARLLIPASGSPGHYRFAHMLVRDAIYDRMDPVERMLLHAKAGEALEELFAGGRETGAHAAELAWHFHEAATLHGPRKAIDYSQSAAEWATTRLAYEDAPAHYERALAALALDPEAAPERHCELTLALGEAQMRAGGRTHAEATLREAAHLARGLDSPTHLANVALALAPGFFSIEVGVYDPYLVALLEEALARLGSGDPPLRARLLARLAMALTWSGRVGCRGDLISESMSIGDHSGSRIAMIDARCAMHGDLWMPEHASTRETLSCEIAALSPDVETALVNLSFRLTQSLERGDILSVDSTINEFSLLERQLRTPGSLWYVGLYRSMRSLMKGRFDQAEALARSFADIGIRAGDRNAAQSFGAQVAIIRWEQGQGDEVVPAIEGYCEQFPAVVAWRACLAFLNMELGRLDEAQIEYEQIAANEFHDVRWNETTLALLMFASEVCARLQDRARASALYRVLRAAQGRYCVVGYGAIFLGAIDRSLGLLSACVNERERAIVHFESAVAQNLRVGSTPWAARAERDLGHTLCRSNSTAERRSGLDVLSRARARALALGMTCLVNQIDTCEA